MTFTIFGLIITLVGACLLIRPGLNGMMIFVIFCSLFGGASAINLPALGGSSIPPAYFALGFLTLRVVLAPDIRRASSASVYKEQSTLILYCLYSAFTAFLLPKLFHGQMDVAPLRSIKGLHSSTIALIPLHFSSQNTTTAVYLIGTLFASVTTMVVCLRPNSHKVIVPGAIALVWTHIGFGLLDLALTHIGHRDWLNVFRNGSYAQLDQNFNGLVRIQGLFPEPSSYATYSFIWFILMTELWLRNVMPRWTGLSAATLAVLLAVSTSSSGYAGLAAYVGLLVLRYLVFPQYMEFRKGLILAFGLLLVATCILGFAAADPKVMADFTKMLAHMTIDKAKTQSGQERLFWARQGLQAFTVSNGFGVGVGSFRSSSLLTAIAGSTGLIGLIIFHLYLLVIMKPMRASTYGAAPSEVEAAGAAAAWAAVGGLIPYEINAPSADPGLVFGFLAGMALAWRLWPGRKRQAAIPGRDAAAPMVGWPRPYAPARASWTEPR